MIVLFCLALMTLAGCKIKIIVPVGGKVVSEDGVVCLSGATCVIEVTDESFDNTFTAVPDPGYVFKGWKKANGYFCGNAGISCRLRTTTFDGNLSLLDVLASDDIFFLQPLFTNNSGYNANWWSKLLAEIKSGNFSTDNYLYSIQPNVDQCDPGALKANPYNRALLVVNRVRAMHKLPAVEYDDFYNMQMQESALVQRANNFLSHFPNPGDDCYTASAEEGAGTSNLGLASEQVDPASDILGWTNDNFNVSALEQAGHRRWVLNPDLGFVTYGQVEGGSSLKVFGFGQPPNTNISPNVEFIAFPYKSYPWVLVSSGDKPTPWSLSLVPLQGVSSKFDHFSGAQIKVKNKDTNQNLAVHSVHSDTDNIGLANFLSWQVNNWDYDTVYKVTITNIAMPGGNKRTVGYDVLLDRFNLVDIQSPLENGDKKQGNVLSGNFNSSQDEDSYTASLAGMKNFSGTSNFSNQAFFIRVYDDRKRLVKSSDMAFSMSFPSGQYTIMVSPCDDDGLCYQNVTNYTVTY
jgi:hypothetical protein